jgi:hypothetical protein
MRHRGSATQTAISVAMWPLIIVFAPVILVAGEPVNRYVMRRVRWGGATVTRVAVVSHGDWPAHAVALSQLPLRVCLLFSATCNPLWIALTAPGRWVSDQFRRPPTHQLS